MTQVTYIVSELRAENFKRLKLVEVRPDGAVVELTGPNEAGKSSLLDALWVGVIGPRAGFVKPIRTGEEMASIRLDLSASEPTESLRVFRTFTAKEGGGTTHSLRVVRADGSAIRESPQAVLDALAGALTFDPLLFARMKPEEQFDLCKGFVPGFDFDQAERANREDYAERTEVNRAAKSLRTQADAIALPSGPRPEPVDVAALETQLADAAGTNARIAAAQASRDAAEAEVTTLTRQIEELTARRDELRKRLAEAQPLPAPVDVSNVQARLAAGREANRVAALFDQRAKLAADAKAKENESQAITDRMEERERAMAKAIREAKMPVAGLGFAAGAVTLNGEPFSQSSQAQRIRASVAIGAALNPKLRVMRITDGSLIDRAGMAWLAQFAAENGLQVWVERVDESGAVGVVIEDGRVTGVHPPSVQPEEVGDVF